MNEFSNSFEFSYGDADWLSKVKDASDNNPFNLKVNVPNVPTQSPFTWKGFLGSVDSKTGKYNPGWAGTALGFLKGGMDTYLGLQQLDVAKDTLNFQKDAFSKQFGAQQKLTNDQLRWQHKAREDRLAGSGGELVQI